jgi:hypothetical protein
LAHCNAALLFFFLGAGFQRFDRDHCSSAMQLSDDELKATLSNSSGWNNVRCVCPLSPSYNYVEFKADNGPNMMIGIVDGDCGRNAYAGQFSNGYCASSPSSPTPLSSLSLSSLFSLFSRCTCRNAGDRGSD